MALSYSPATAQDIDFITGLIMTGARKGHFYPQLADHKTQLRKIVQTTVQYGVHDANGLFSEAMIGRHGTVRAGITIITGTEKTDNSIELAVIAVKKEFQGTGIGRTMLDALVQRWLPFKTIYVRCFPVSEQLVQMLLNRGFSIIQTTASGTRILRREQEILPQHGNDTPFIHVA